MHPDSETLMSPPCRAIFDHWIALRCNSPRADNIPVRSQIDLCSLPLEAIPWFFIHQRENDRYFNRLSGTSMVSALGFEMTGKYLDELMAADKYPQRKALFDFCFTRNCLIHYRASLAISTKDHVGFSRVIFPVALDEAGEASLACGTMVFFDDAALLPSEKTKIQTGIRGVLYQAFHDGDKWQELETA